MGLQLKGGGEGVWQGDIYVSTGLLDNKNKKGFNYSSSKTYGSRCIALSKIE